MSDEKRRISIIKQGKKYLGGISIPSDMYRTTDYFNRPGMMRHRDNQGTLDSYIQLYDVEMIVDDNIVLKRQPELNRANMITPMYGSQFYEISGAFYGRFKRAMVKNFLSLTNATIDHFFKKPETDKWNKKPIALPYDFVALNMSFVDSYSLKTEE